MNPSLPHIGRDAVMIGWTYGTINSSCGDNRSLIRAWCRKVRSSFRDNIVLSLMKTVTFVMWIVPILLNVIQRKRDSR